MAAPLDASSAPPPRNRRALRAAALTSVATFLALALLLAERDAQFFAAVTLSEGHASGDGDNLDEANILASARELFPEARLTCAPVAGPEVGRAFRLEATSADTTSADATRLAERLNACGAALVARWNEKAAASATEDAEKCRQAVRDARRRRDALEKKVRLLEEATAEAGSEVDLPDVHVEAPAAPNHPPATAQAAERDSPRTALLAKVKRLEDELSNRRQRFTDAHPEVQFAELALAEAKAELAALPPGAPIDQESPERSHQPDIAPRLNPPAAADSAYARAEQAARLDLADANRQLAAATAAEAAASRRHAQSLASLPWRCEPTSAATKLYTGEASAPWPFILVVAIAVGGVAGFLARGLRPTIDNLADAVAVLSVPVVGVLRADDPQSPPRPDPGVIGARWLTRIAAVTIAVAITLTLLAAGNTPYPGRQVASDPASLFTLAREWLAPM